MPKKKQPAVRAVARAVRPTVASQPFLDAQLAPTAKGVRPPAAAGLPLEIRGSAKALGAKARRFHGAKFSLAYFPPGLWKPAHKRCGNWFGYLSPALLRRRTRLLPNPQNQALLDELGALMGDLGRETPPDSTIPAGFTYAGQFIDHDITLDVSSSLDTPANANDIPNMRTPALDLDNVYGRGPALDPFLYDFPPPSSPTPTAIRMALGRNLPSGAGGPTGPANNPGAMQQQTDWDVPRVDNADHTAVIGDPRNDENLIVAQLQHAMLRFHNAVVDHLVATGFAGDIFLEAKRLAVQHYQWAVVHDFLGRICGTAAVNAAMAGVSAGVGSSFRMPVEFAVGAYRFGHSMIRDRYWLNFNFPGASLGEVFAFNRVPNLPVRSNWVVDFNAFFETGNPIVVFNRARPIDSVLAAGLESLPGLAGMLAVLAQRNLRRGLMLGLPSGQGMAKLFGVPKLTEAQLTSGLPANEVAVLQKHGKRLLKKTPLWYYVLREARVLGGGNRLGPVGGRIVAETFVRILKRDGDSYLNTGTPFTPSLPSAAPGQFTFADLVNFAGVTAP
ncbi:MAG: hypothetical protein H6732_05840 [Alphaproteobacteria bacterium]|nr:hypothetical protein [Alphaproteobacteria bacterium]